MNKSYRYGFLSLAVLAGILPASAAIIHYDRTVNGPIEEATSWVEGVVPGPDDLVWIDKITDPNVTEYVGFTFNEDTHWKGIYLHADSKEIKLTLSQGNNAVLTLGSEGLQTSSSNIKGIDVNVDISFSADSFFGSGATMSITKNINLCGHRITVLNGSTKQFKSAINGPGTLVMQGNVNPQDGIIFDNVDLEFLDGGAEANFSGALSDQTLCRLGGVVAEGDAARLKFYNEKKNGVCFNRLSRPIMLKRGELVFTSEQKKPNKYVTHVPSLVNAFDDAFVAYQGTNLGAFALDDYPEVNHANVIYDVVPDMIGAASGAGRAIIPYSTLNWTNFVTYSETHGVRALDPETECADGIVDGATDAVNARLVNEGTGIRTITLESPLTTVNSLYIREMGAGGTGDASSGVVITGAGEQTLRVNSGLIFVSQETTTPTVDDKVILDAPFLDFNEKAGCISLYKVTGMSNGSGNAPLSFRSIPVNTTNVMFYGAYGAATGSVFLEGERENDYTGDITVGPSVYMRLNRTTPNTAIKGRLVIKGGSVQYANQLDDETADVIVYSGSSTIKTGASNSGDGGREVFRDLVMFGGTHTVAGGGGGSTYMRSAYLQGGKFSLTQAVSGAVSEGLVMSGGCLTMASTTDKSRHGAFFHVNGCFEVTNTPGTVAYTPLTVGYSKIVRPNRLVVHTPIKVFADETNENPVLFAAKSAAGSWEPQLALDGETEFFVEDGLAENDVECQLDVADGWTSVPENATGGTAVQGLLVKTGAGTLYLSAATNSLTGGVTVQAGTLRTASVFSGTSMTVETGAKLSVCGAMELTGNLTIDGGSLEFEGAAAALAVTGAIELKADSTVIASLPNGVTERLLATATGGISGIELATVQPGCAMLTLRKNGSELWLRKKGFCFIVR